jgi:RHS repeat-associated protein
MHCLNEVFKKYYPSGLPWASNSGDNPWMQNKKYNGKEFVEMHGLDSYDYLFRSMQSSKMRFDTPDALMELHYDVSPYAYCLNNPINYVDPFGLDTCRYDPKDDTYIPLNNELPEVTVFPNKDNRTSNTMNWLYFGMTFTNGMAQIGTAYSKGRYTPGTPWRTGYYTTSNGKTVSLNELKPDANGKFIKGVQGHRNAINGYKANLRLLNRTLTGLNYVAVGYDFFKLFGDKENIGNWVAVSIDGASYFFWEVGVVAAGVQGMTWAASGEMQQIQTNIMNNENPLNNVYVPGLGTTYYSPF